MALTDSFLESGPSAPDFLQLTPYDARHNSIDLLKAGYVETFNAAQKTARARQPDFRLNLTNVGILHDRQTAWAMLLEQVYGGKGVTKTNLAFAGDENAWDRLRGIAYDRGIRLREDLLAALRANNEQPEAANLAWTNLSGVDFRTTDLRQVDFTWTIATNADFSGADMRGCNFRSADLKDADFTGANVEGVNLSGADLSGARGLTAEQLAGATINEETILPDQPERSVDRRYALMTREEQIDDIARRIECGALGRHLTF